MQTYLQYTNVSTNELRKKEVQNWINTTLAAYAKKNVLNQTEVEHILDYLLSDKAPSRLQKMSYEQAKSGTDKWNAALVKKGANIVETEEDVEVVLRTRPEEPEVFKYVRLKTKAAYDREGNLMRHCVGSYYGKSEVEIYSLRDGNNMPHCTIELQKSGNRINQIKGKGNGPIHPKYIKFILKALQYHNLDINEREMENLGYISFDEQELSFIRQNFSENELKFVVFKNKTFYYTECFK